MKIKNYTCQFNLYVTFLVKRYLDNHVKGCGNSRKDEEIQQDQKHELIVGSPSNHTGSNPGTVILISNEGQQAFMVANTNDSQTITLTQDVWILSDTQPLSKDVFRNGRNIQFWLFSLRDQLLSLIMLHKLTGHGLHSSRIILCTISILALT